jgi:hypothetical protein
MTERYLGSGYAVTDTTSLTGTVPAHLPQRLAITLFDFSWYTRAGAGEPYEDIDHAVADAASRGYNAVRICAAPLLTFGDLGLDDLASNLEFEGLGAAPGGGYYGQGTRWYDTPGGYSIDVRSRLLELFAACRRHGLVVILASWEYQQSTSFARNRRWFDAIDRVPLEDRYAALARAFDAMLAELDSHGYSDLVAFTELHNEIDFSVLPAAAHGGAEALDWLRCRHPDTLVTLSYGKPPHLAMHSLPDTFDVAQFHIYSYGVLDALQTLLDIRSEGTQGFPNALLSSMLKPGAPSVADYGRAAAWKFDATVITDQMVYGYDWIDADKWDLWLYNAYGDYREVMHREIESRVTAVAAWARAQRIPTVVGEGWVGYTPLAGTFEEGPVGRDLAEHGIRTALAQGVWGVVLCSNAAPHHPMWENVDWQRRMNAEILAAPTTAVESA